MVRFRRVIAIGLAAVLLAPGLAWSQSIPPLPRPRPDRNATQAAAPSAPQIPPVPADRPTAATTTPPAADTNTSASEAIGSITSDPQPVHLSAKVTDGGTDIAQGVVWRIFDAKADATGDVSMVAKSDEAEANITLPPGDYVVHVAYGRAQASDTLTVTPGNNTKTLILDAGALRLNAAIVGDIAIPSDLEHFDIFTSGNTDADRTPVAQNISPGEVVTLNAGTYHVVSYFGAINAVVRADLRVEPGQMTEATLYHQASQVAFKLVSETGGEAIADIDWTVKDKDGKTLFSDVGAFPATVLQEGDYEVFAKRGDTVYNRQFAVAPGQPADIEVLTTVY
ncbi:MAG TPA: hypothetical protein VGM83_05300 [Devosiaceae bacterium]